MPFSTTTLVRFTAKLSRCLSLALLPALASETHAAVSQPQRKQNVRSAQPGATPRTAEKKGSLPYLAALGPLPLRFARPGPEPAENPPAPPERKPAPVVEIAPPATNDKLAPPAAEKEPVATPPATNTPDHAAEPSSEFSEPSPQRALPILPDDTKRELRAEDVLPFFIYPIAPNSGKADVQVVIPLTESQSQSNPSPPSSATYQQK